LPGGACRRRAFHRPAKPAKQVRPDSIPARAQKKASIMSVHLKTLITAIGPEVAELAEGGVLILFADGAPPELAEVSVLHKAEVGPSDAAPVVGAAIAIGELEGTITAMGDSAWNKVREIGHVVINFNGADAAERPGEICASVVEGDVLVGALKAGAAITIGR
jgi:PTS system glucitol/sorbitol-specific IIA component